MTNKKLLAIVLLSSSFCFVSGVEYKEIEEWMVYIDFKPLEAKVNYIMAPPASFLDVSFYYDPDGST